MRNYRGKRIDDGEWVYGDKLEVEESVYIIPDNAYISCDEYGNDKLVGFIEVVPETVGRSPGRKDKDGVDIYGGDIMEYVGKACPECGQKYKYPGHKLYEIKDKGTEFVCENDSNFMVPSVWSTDMKVVGSITDNPELMDERAKE